MNRVHEQCPKIDSGTVLSQTGSKQAECTACWPSSTPRPHAQAARPTPVPRAPCLLPLAPPAPACLRAPSPLACAPAACPARPCHAPRPPLPAPSAVSWPGWSCRETVQQPTAPTATIQYFLLQYKFSPASLLYCNTIASPSNCIAIHLPSRPATAHSCNTICCIAIQFSPYATIQSNTSCNTLSSQPATHPCNTICCIAIQFGQ